MIHWDQQYMNPENSEQKFVKWWERGELLIAFWRDQMFWQGGSRAWQNAASIMCKF